MENHKELKLADGHYKPTEAKEFLLGLINGKLGFHNLELMRKLEWDEPGVGECQQAIQELKDEKKDIIALMNKAKELGLEIQLKGSIEISVQQKVPQLV